MKLYADHSSKYHAPIAGFLKVFIYKDKQKKELTNVTKLNLFTGEYSQYKTDENNNLCLDEQNEVIIEDKIDTTLWIEVDEQTPIWTINHLLNHLHELCN